VAGAAAFLAERLGPGVTDVTAFERQGDWSRAFAFRHEGRDLVARFSALAEDFEKDRLATRYRGPALPVPDVLALDEAPGGFFCISERLFGAFLDDLDEAQMRALLPALFAMLDAMRLADVSDSAGYREWDAAGRGTFPSWQAAMLDVAVSRPNDRIAGWRERLEASPTGAAPFDRAFERLRGLVPGLPEARHLIHSDLLHYNVLVQDDRISGVLDWGCGMYGDFLFDVAWLCFWAPWYPAWNGIDVRAEARRHYQTIGLDVPRFEQRLLAYELYIGLSGQAYQAYKGYLEDLEATARHTLAVADIIAETGAGHEGS
jgi:hygromycin-B 4-O-kinase